MNAQRYIQVLEEHVLQSGEVVVYFSKMMLNCTHTVNHCILYVLPFYSAS